MIDDRAHALRGFVVEDQPIGQLDFEEDVEETVGRSRRGEGRKVEDPRRVVDCLLNLAE